MFILSYEDTFLDYIFNYEGTLFGVMPIKIADESLKYNPEGSLPRMGIEWNKAKPMKIDI